MYRIGLLRMAVVFDSLCRGLDQRLKSLLDDAICYLQSTVGQTSSTDSGPFNRFEHMERIQKFVQTACESCITKLVSVLSA